MAGAGPDPLRDVLAVPATLMGDSHGGPPLHPECAGFRVDLRILLIPSWFCRRLSTEGAGPLSDLGETCLLLIGSASVLAVGIVRNLFVLSLTVVTLHVPGTFPNHLQLVNFFMNTSYPIHFRNFRNLPDSRILSAWVLYQRLGSGEKVSEMVL